jgi:hypothetical protein
MPNSFLPAAVQGGAHTKEGVMLLGDAWNMRHPLTGGGMTVALNDVVLLADLLRGVQCLREWDEVERALETWHWKRKGLSATVNILSVALYSLFGADGERAPNCVGDHMSKCGFVKMITLKHCESGVSSILKEAESVSMVQCPFSLGNSYQSGILSFRHLPQA